MKRLEQDRDANREIDLDLVGSHRWRDAILSVHPTRRRQLDTFFRNQSFRYSLPLVRLGLIQRLPLHRSKDIPIITITMLAASSRVLLRSTAASVGSKTVLKAFASRHGAVSSVTE
jgi:hypothetical protein